MVVKYAQLKVGGSENIAETQSMVSYQGCLGRNMNPKIAAYCMQFPDSNPAANTTSHPIHGPCKPGKRVRGVTPSVDQKGYCVIT